MNNKEQRELLMSAVQTLMKLYKDLCDTQAERQKMLEEIKKTAIAI